MIESLRRKRYINFTNCVMCSLKFNIVFSNHDLNRSLILSSSKNIVNTNLTLVDVITSNKNLKLKPKGKKIIDFGVWKSKIKLIRSNQFTAGMGHIVFSPLILNDTKLSFLLNSSISQKSIFPL